MNQFEYTRPLDLRAVVQILGERDDASLLAGGQTLVPTMKQGLAAPELLIDLGAVSELARLDISATHAGIGAMCPHAAVAASSLLADKTPGLAELAGMIGDPQVRNRGTIGGSVANNDPAADYPAACLALDAVIRTDRRDIPADTFFRGLFETDLEPGEIITKVVFPLCRGSAYIKFRNPASRFALVGVFVARHASGVRVAATGAGKDGVFRWREAEAALSADFAEKAIAGLAIQPDQMLEDLHAKADYRAHLIGVMTGRAVSAVKARSPAEQPGG